MLVVHRPGSLTCQNVRTTRRRCRQVSEVEQGPDQVPPSLDSWPTLREAADLLGVSQKTLRRRLSNGSLEGRKVEGPHGPEWRIDVESLSELELPAATESATALARLEGAMVKQLRELAEALAQAEEGRGRAEATAEHLRERLDEQRTQADELKAETKAARATAEQLLEKLEAERSRRWWQRRRR